MTNKKRVGVLTNGQLLSLKAKMAHGALRYRDDINVIIDNKYIGQNSEQILPYISKRIPIVGSIEEAQEYEINELLIGVSPPGGQLDSSWEKLIDTCLLNNIRVISGLHMRFSKHDKYKYYAQNELIKDLRYEYRGEEIFTGKGLDVQKNVVLTVGSDCGSGKMTTALELYNAFVLRGLKVDFIPTGQTGMYIRGNGFAIDTVVSDFMAGAIENFVVESASKGHDYIFVEGQGSITHQAYSGVTCGLLHGAVPNILILCHDISRRNYKYFKGQIPSLADQIEIYEKLASFNRDCRVLGISLFADGVSQEKLEEIILKMESEFGIPVFAPLINGVDKMVNILTEF